jgi:hypothetical protein
METKYFAIANNENVTSEEIANLIFCRFGDAAHGVVVSDPLPNKPVAPDNPQHPTVPIQFVILSIKVIYIM